MVYNYYGGVKDLPQVNTDMMFAVDRCDAAQFTESDIHKPQGWILLNFLMDPRTGLGRFREFDVSNYDLMMALVDHCQTKSIADILELPDVRQRSDLYFDQAAKAISQINHCSTVHDNLVVIDLRKVELIHATNRFMVYALFPECNVSMHVLWGRKQQNTVFAMGKSILNRSCAVNIGALGLKYDGGGHANAGTCQIANSRADKVCRELIEQLTPKTPVVC